MNRFTYHLRIAGIHLCILAQRAIHFPDSYAPFISTDSFGEPDWTVEVIFDAEPTIQAGDIVKRFPRLDGHDLVRVVSAGRVNICRFFVPSSMADAFAIGANWTLFLTPEYLLLPYGRFFLHASGVCFDGEAVIFTAPSGGGKSTQAALWEATFGAEIINGDKVILSSDTTRPVAYGSPIAGSSGIYKNMQAPIRAIVSLQKATPDAGNTVRRLDARHAFMTLYSQAVKRREDEAFNRTLLPLVAAVAESVPVLELTCKPEPSAALSLRSWLNTNAPIGVQ